MNPEPTPRHLPTLLAATMAAFTLAVAAAWFAPLPAWASLIATAAAVYATGWEVARHVETADDDPQVPDDPARATGQNVTRA